MKGWIHPPVDIADLPACPGSMIREKKVVATFSTVPKSIFLFLILFYFLN